MKFIFMIMAILLLTTTGFAQEVKTKDATPEQAAVLQIQQQRNQALAQVGDLQANLAYLQAQDRMVSQYWADYVMGLYGPKQLEK